MKSKNSYPFPRYVVTSAAMDAGLKALHSTLRIMGESDKPELAITFVEQFRARLGDCTNVLTNPVVYSNDPAHFNIES